MIRSVIKYLFTLLVYLNSSIEATPIKNIITYENYITANGKYPTRLYHEELTPELKQNAKNLLKVVNAFLLELGYTEVVVTSGFRPNAVNSSTKGAGKGSKHLICRGIDLADADGKLMNLVLNNLHLIQKYGLATENFNWTPSWIHLQDILPNSGKRIFIPSLQPAPKPNRWSGTYDPKYNKVLTY